MTATSPRWIRPRTRLPTPLRIRLLIPPRTRLLIPLRTRLLIPLLIRLLIRLRTPLLIPPPTRLLIPPLIRLPASKASCVAGPLPAWRRAASLDSIERSGAHAPGRLFAFMSGPAGRRAATAVQSAASPVWPASGVRRRNQPATVAAPFLRMRPLSSSSVHVLRSPVKLWPTAVMYGPAVSRSVV